MGQDFLYEVPYSGCTKLPLEVPFDKQRQPIPEALDPPTFPSTESLMREMEVPDLNKVHKYLWLAGSYRNISALHHQRVILREVIPSEDPRLHLLWFNRIIYIKPLPDYLLDAQCFKDVVCKNSDLYSLVMGFLLSYCCLIKHPLDLAIAKELKLVSDKIVWARWALFQTDILKHLENLERSKEIYINDRYKYGELRLSRLNIIWRLTGRGLAYFTVHRVYETYFREYFALFITAFAFVTVVLTAMQVIVGLQDGPPLMKTVSYRFSVASLFGVVLCLSCVALIFFAMILYNLIKTSVRIRQRRKH